VFAGIQGQSCERIVDDRMYFVCLIRPLQFVQLKREDKSALC
jgi:hypothetical protein